MTTENCCRNCKYFIEDHIEYYHECHRYPPAAVPREVKNRHTGDTLYLRWPTISYSQWCGEFVLSEKEG